MIKQLNFNKTIMSVFLFAMGLYFSTSANVWAQSATDEVPAEIPAAENVEELSPDQLREQLNNSDSSSVDEGAMIMLNFQDADIRSLIDTVSQLTQKNFLVDPRVRGNFTIISGRALPVDQMYEVFLSVLQTQGLSAVTEGDLIKIVPSTIIRQESLPTVTDTDGFDRNDVVTYIYELQNGSVQTILPIIQPLMPPSSYITSHLPSNTLIISSTKGNIDRVLDIVNKVDTPDETLDVNIVYLEYAKASRVGAILSQMIANIQASAAAQGRPSNFNISIQADDVTNSIIIQAPTREFNRVDELISKLDIQRGEIQSDIHVIYLQNTRASRIADIIKGLQENQATKAQEAEGQITNIEAEVLSQISIQADDNINAIIIQAPYDQYLVYQSIIDQLDIESTADTGNIHVYYLKYASAVDLAGVLNTIVADSQNSEDGVDVGAEVKIEADESSNALIIRSDDRDFKEIENVIAKLDLRRSQVYVEAIIAEISESDSQSLGIQWQGATSDLNGRQGVLTGGTSGFVDPEGGGLNLGFLRGNIIIGGNQIVPEFSAILNALRTDNNSNILSTPNILTLENEEAEILVGQEVPFITGSFDDGNNTSTVDGDGNTSQTTSNRFQNIERRDVGLRLNIKPQINEGNTIRLEIEQEVSNISPVAIAGASDLVTDNREIKTVVEVDNNQIVVLGGLIQEEATDSISKVPILGDIPILGALFRSKTKTATRRNLMIFLKPQIINDRKDIAGATRDNYLKMQDIEALSLPDSRFLLRDTEPAVLPDVDWSKEIEPAN